MSCGAGLIPLDKWFGTFRDVSSGADARVNACDQRRNAKATAKTAAQALQAHAKRLNSKIS